MKDNNTTNAAQNLKIPQSRKFEIQVYDLDYERDDTKPELHPVRQDRAIIIEASSPADLKYKLGLYQQCGQVAKVIREIDPPRQNESSENSNIVVENNIITKEQDTCDLTSVDEHSTETPVIQSNTPNKASVHIEQSSQRQKPKYYKVGDIEIKDDNGKLYQKQWMCLTDTEASNLRVINSKNNSVVNMTGKHFEMKKWVLVENHSSDDSTALEENLNEQ